MRERLKNDTELNEEELLMKTLKNILAEVDGRKNGRLASKQGNLDNRLFWNQVITRDNK
ncbi:hypothetical protein HMPREF9104_02432 [Lentilactobacillus kisonensis F0435]|uniref:Uncharacterized protein n=1 Tax=Lentilactobacillus kisonensis F0435 TaxID=797516 RepID=H1LIJ1_9LACO|nr:hypothetical protein HMPREF9104_02432 [Lentilactobacillus kisonensis F0435]